MADGNAARCGEGKGQRGKKKPLESSPAGRPASSCRHDGSSTAEAGQGPAIVSPHTIQKMVRSILVLESTKKVRFLSPREIEYFREFSLCVDFTKSQASNGKRISRMECDRKSFAVGFILYYFANKGRANSFIAK